MNKVDPICVESTRQCAYKFAHRYRIPCPSGIPSMYLGYLARSLARDETGRDEPSPGPESCGCTAHAFSADESKKRGNEIFFPPSSDNCSGFFAGSRRSRFPECLSGRERRRFQPAANDHPDAQYRNSAIWHRASWKQQDAHLHRRQLGS